MDPKLLDYYNQELSFMREMSKEFSAAHPKIAKRLGMHGIDVADPYIERLIEAFCLLNARTQIKLDAEFPRFTERLLEVIFPNYVAPTPSMAVAHFSPSMSEGDFRRGFTLNKGAVLRAKIAHEEKTSVEFRTGLPVTLWPIKIVSAKLTGAPPDISSLERYLPPHVQVKGALRLRLAMEGPLNFSDLQGLDQLPFYLCGEERLASHLFELIHTGSVATLTGAPGKLAEQRHVVNSKAVGHLGLEPEESLLPNSWSNFHGHTLLHEYFACPLRFLFFSLNALAPGLSAISGQEAEIVVLLNKLPGTLASHVSAEQFALFCAPIINLFPKHTDRIAIHPSQTEFHVVPDRSQPIDYEIFSVLALSGQKTDQGESIAYRPLYHTLNNDEGNYGRYFSVRRETRLASDTTRKYGTRTPYAGTEVFVSLVDQHERPFPEDIRYLSVEALVTNRDLPMLAPRNGHADLDVPQGIPIHSCGLIRPPSTPRPPLAGDNLAWRLIRQLNLNYIPLSDLDTREGGQALRDLLRLFVPSDAVEQQQQMAGLIGSQTRPVMRRLPGSGPLVYGRGIEIQLTIDETHFSGQSPYLLGLILERYLARHVSINVFTQTELHSMQRGLIGRWPIRPGHRNAL